MANYYVVPAGTPGNTPAAPYNQPITNAANTIGTVMVYIAASGAAGSNIYVADGSYATNIAADNAKHDNTTIYGNSRTGVIATSTAGNDQCVLAANVTVNIHDMTLRSTSNDKSSVKLNNTTGTLNLYNCDLSYPSGANTYRINNLGSTLNCYNCRIYHGSGVSASINYAGDAGGSFNNCIIQATLDYKYANGVYIDSTGTTNFNNCLLLDMSGHGIHCAGGVGTTNINNCVITAGLINVASYPVVRTAPHTVSITNSHLIANTWDGDTLWVSGAYTDGGGNIHSVGGANLINANPKFKTYQRKGYIVVTCDDSNATSFAHAQGIASKLSEYGMKGTYCLSQYDWDTGNNAALRTMVADGNMEVACHSYSHSALGATGKIWDIAGGTLTIDRTADTITASTDALNPITGFKAKLLSAIKTELDAKGLTVTATALYGADTTDVHPTALGESLDNAAALSTEVKLLIDATGASGYFKAEIGDPKTWLADTIVNGAGNVTDGQTGLTYVCNSFGFPYQGSSTDARAAVIALGYTGARSSKIAGAGTVADAMFMTDVDPFQMWSIPSFAYLKGDGSEAAIRYNARAIGIAVAHAGLCVVLTTHTDGEMSPTQYGYCFDEWRKFGDALSVTSLQLAAADIAARLTDDGDGTYSATGANAFTVSGDDYHPDPGSPLLRAGTAVVGLTTDFDGTIVPLAGGYNIGPYNNQFAGGGLSPGLGLSGGNRPPWWNRRRR